MFLLDLLLAMLIALVLTALVLPLAAWRHPGRGTLGIDGTTVAFFLVVLLGAWIGGLALAPLSPGVWATSWLGFLASGLVVAGLLAASSGAVGLPVGASGRLVDRRDGPRTGALLLLGGLAILVLAALVLAWLLA